MANGLLELDTGLMAVASVVGKTEHDGPLGDLFDEYDENDRFGKDTFERSESEMQRLALNVSLAKGSLTERDVDLLFAGDLLNQCVGSS